MKGGNWRLLRSVVALSLPTVLVAALGVFFFVDKVPEIVKAEKNRVKAEYRETALELRQNPGDERFAREASLPPVWRGSFAGKMHALLCRQYLKGRDWFDFVWYVGERVGINHALLSAALDQQGPWAGQGVISDDKWVKKQLQEVIRRIDWDEARRDVLPFVYAADRRSVDLWDYDFFDSLLDRL